MQMVYRIEVKSQLGAAEEHIDTVRMALSKPESDWCGTKDYQDNLMNELCAGLNLGLDRPPKQEMSWTDNGTVADVVEIWMTLSPAFSGYRVMRQRQAFADPNRAIQ